MVIPALVWMVLINIVPMFGIIMAFQDFNPGKGIFRSKISLDWKILSICFSSKTSLRFLPIRLSSPWASFF